MQLADRILVVDDDAQLRRGIGQALRAVARAVDEAGTGGEAIASVEREAPDLVVLDLGLPDLDGLDVCRALRERTVAPIVVLSARHDEREKVRLLEAGADDYVTKPFGLSELLARVQAQLRRAVFYAHAPPKTITLGDLTLDLARRTVTRGGAAVHLTPVEWSLLRVLALQPGRTLTHEQLFHAVWGRTYGDAKLHLRVHITHLRRKIEERPAEPALIVTEPGVGYRCEQPEQPEQPA
jgi:two-component system KDP operon response regulator KdpE